jgi:hypothetical protein
MGWDSVVRLRPGSERLLGGEAGREVEVAGGVLQGAPRPVAAEPAERPDGAHADRGPGQRASPPQATVLLRAYGSDRAA